MRTLKLLGAALALFPAAVAIAQVDVHVTFPAPPPLVVVSPGVQVVPDYEEEVFYVNRYYWLRRDGRWYRTRDYHRGWVYCEPRMVPASIVRIPPGQYRHWHKEEAKAMRREEKAERHAWKEHEKAERHAWKEHEKAERHAEKHGHGRGH